MKGISVLEAGFPWQELRDVARREGTVKPPIYAMHRWWARRSPTLFRFILAAAAIPAGSLTSVANGANGRGTLHGKVVLDPFMGGGTSLVEGARLGARVVGYDTESLAAWITESELQAFGSNLDWDPLDASIKAIESKLGVFYPAPNGWRLLHYFWVARAQCSACLQTYDAHPNATLATNPVQDFRIAICRYCSRLHKVRYERRRVDCECGGRTNIDDHNVASGTTSCPICGHRERVTTIVSRRGPLPYKLFAKELIFARDAKRRRFTGVTDTDRRAYAAAVARLGAGASLDLPSGAIPVGRHDGRPQVFGINDWRDMFNARQLLHHGYTRSQLASLPEPMRRYAQLAFSESLATNCMFCFYSPSYRRIAAAFSIHDYMWVTRPAELNPWILGSGRGTLRNCIRKVRRGVSSVQGLDPADYQVHVSSSEAMTALRSESVDIILTDPPFYHDNVEYDRLAAFYWTWARSNGRLANAAPLQLSKGKGEFAARLAKVFRECVRVMKGDGILAFTFAHAREDGWAALDEALLDSGLSVTAAIPVEAEGSNGFHSNPGNLKWNGLFVLRKGRPEAHFDAAPLTQAAKDRSVSAADRVNLRRALAVAMKHSAKEGH